MRSPGSRKFGPRAYSVQGRRGRSAECTYLCYGMYIEGRWQNAAVRHTAIHMFKIGAAFRTRALA